MGCAFTRTRTLQGGSHACVLERLGARWLRRGSSGVVWAATVCGGQQPPWLVWNQHAHSEDDAADYLDLLDLG